MRKVTARAPVNIALIKYWGKKDEINVIPYNSSLSITLDNLYTETTISESEEFKFILNDVNQGLEECNKVKTFLKHFASLDAINKVSITSVNFVETAAGLASSASGYAALATAANSYFNTNLSINELSKISRLGSGSSTRSFHGGMVAWDRNNEIYQVESKFKEFVMISVIVDQEKKYISSREAMKITVNTSPLYPTFVSESNKYFEVMKEALYNGDIKLIGELTEKSTVLLHETMEKANPSIKYIQDESRVIWDMIYKARSKGLYSYISMDAGPNVKVLTNEKDYLKIINILEDNNFKYYHISRMGEGAIIIG